MGWHSNAGETRYRDAGMLCHRFTRRGWPPRVSRGRRRGPIGVL